MDLHGAKISEIIGVANAITRDAKWTRNGMLFIADGSIAGVSLRVRQQFRDQGLISISLKGNRWLLSFQVTKQRPRSFTDDMPSEMVWLFQAPWRRGADAGVRRCVHRPSFISPDQFQKEMALLRMFETEWEA